MDICVIEWMILNLFSDFHSLTFLTTDELRICYKRINHSITQSFCFWFLSLIKVRLIDWLTYCVNQRINQSTNTWMDKRCSLYAVNNNYKIIITNKLVFCYKDIVYSSFFQSYKYPLQFTILVHSIFHSVLSASMIHFMYNMCLIAIHTHFKTIFAGLLIHFQLWMIEIERLRYHNQSHSHPFPFFLIQL